MSNIVLEQINISIESNLPIGRTVSAMGNYQWRIGDMLDRPPSTSLSRMDGIDPNMTIKDLIASMSGQMKASHFMAHSTTEGRLVIASP